MPRKRRVEIAYRVYGRGIGKYGRERWIAIHKLPTWEAAKEYVAGRAGEHRIKCVHIKLNT